MSESEFLASLKELNISLDEKQIKQLELYATHLLKYNEHTNLTAIKKIDEVYLKHFYDSLTINKVIDLTEEKKVLDIGTGAGFPGLVLAICFPNLEVHLLDSNNKKIAFLDEMIKILNLTNAKTIYKRSEEYAKDHKEEYDVVTSRAVAEMRILIEITFPLLKVKGYFIAMKSSIEEELKSSTPTIEILNGRIEQIENFELPFNAGTRNIVAIKKAKNTPKEYPRSFSTILKKPLKKKGF